ncbi:MAG: hypothetical protein HKP27_17050 [Myxococcales bacterium]|nr:hypothetical protein [Myxococcales bacterium]
MLALMVLCVFLLGASSQLRGQIARSGAVILQRREAVAPLDLADGKMVGIEAISVFEPGAEQNRLLGLRLDWNALGMVGAERYAYLDLHEIDEVIRALAFMTTELAHANHPENVDREGRLRTREGFAVGYFARGGQVRRYVDWAPGNLRADLGEDGFIQLRERFELARDRLFAD